MDQTEAIVGEVDVGILVYIPEPGPRAPVEDDGVGSEPGKAPRAAGRHHLLRSVDQRGRARRAAPIGIGDGLRGRDTRPAQAHMSLARSLTCFCISIS